MTDLSLATVPFWAVSFGINPISKYYFTQFPGSINLWHLIHLSIRFSRKTFGWQAFHKIASPTDLVQLPEPSGRPLISEPVRFIILLKNEVFNKNRF